MIPVVFSTDHNFIMPTSVAISSMLRNSTDVKCDIYVLQAKDVTDSDRNILCSIIENSDSRIQFVSINNESMEKGFVVRNISTATYYRLVIPWIIKDYDKICYVDGDVVFLDSISNLYNSNIDGCYVGGVSPYDLGDYQSNKIHAPKIGCVQKDYINAGVLVINAKKWRDDNLYDEFSKHLSVKYECQDQDIINIVCKGKIKHINKECNVLSRKFYETDRCTILHFAGEKPWKKVTEGWNYWYDEYHSIGLYDHNLVNQIISNTTSLPEYSNTSIIKMFINKNVPFLLKIYTKLRYGI